MRCNRRISLNAGGTKETYCMEELTKTDPKTGLLYHDGRCRARCCGHFLYAYDPNAVTAEVPVAQPIETNEDIALRNVSGQTKS